MNVTVTDTLTSVARLEVVADGKAIFLARPDDGVCDSLRETFKLSASDAGTAGSRIVRAIDAAGNVAESPVPGP